MRARAWFGAAVAMHMQREDETAIDAFKKAADMAESGGRVGAALVGGRREQCTAAELAGGALTGPAAAVQAPPPGGGAHGRGSRRDAIGA